jgi:hypothetical protein
MARFCSNQKIAHLLRHLAPHILPHAERFDKVIDQLLDDYYDLRLDPLAPGSLQQIPSNLPSLSAECNCDP